jgi:hypothetical protein
MRFMQQFASEWVSDRADFREHIEGFVIPKSGLTSSEKVWGLLIQSCENSCADSNGRRLRIQT